MEAVNGPGNSSMVVHHRATANRTKRPSHPTSQARADAPPHAHKCAWGGRGICAADAGQRQRLREPEASAGSSAAMYTDAFPRMPSGLFGSKATLYPCAARGLSTLAACLYGCQPIPRPPGEMATPHPTTEIRLWIQVMLLCRPWHGVCAAAAACGSVHAGARPDACVCLAVARSRRALCAASDLLRLNHPALPVMSLRCGRRRTVV